jgi:hypothetical protein
MPIPAEKSGIPSYISLMQVCNAACTQGLPLGLAGFLRDFVCAGRGASSLAQTNGQVGSRPPLRRTPGVLEAPGNSRTSRIFDRNFARGRFRGFAPAAFLEFAL